MTPGLQEDLLLRIRKHGSAVRREPPDFLRVLRVYGRPNRAKPS
jgi:hypothetical protein